MLDRMLYHGLDRRKKSLGPVLQLFMLRLSHALYHIL